MKTVLDGTDTQTDIQTDMATPRPTRPSGAELVKMPTNMSPACCLTHAMPSNQLLPQMIYRNSNFILIPGTWITRNPNLTPLPKNYILIWNPKLTPLPNTLDIGILLHLSCFLVALQLQAMNEAMNEPRHFRPRGFIVYTLKLSAFVTQCAGDLMTEICNALPYVHFVSPTQRHVYTKYDM